MAKIDQSSNFLAQFGEIYRSSAIFLVPDGIKTKISFMNYWKVKNDLAVTLLVTERDKSGRLHKRVSLDWSQTGVHNYVPEIDEGSVEIEAFGNTNLRIPYAAIMAIYETDSSVTMVHAYGRNHSLIELEDARAIIEGREGCWTIDPRPGVRNVAYFHNGHAELVPQECRIVLTLHDGSERMKQFSMPAIAPFETVAFDVEKIWPDYADVLQGETGWATVHFESKSAFTRMIVSRYDTRTKEFQVTHSNFDYSEHDTDLISATKPAYMKLPTYEDIVDNQVVVYPRFTPGRYILEPADVEHFEVARLLGVERGASLAFSRSDGELPSRIVTGYRGRRSHDALPFECSLGVIHQNQPPKRFHWGVVSAAHGSRIYLTSYEEIYGAPDGPLELSFALYGFGSVEPLKRTIVVPALHELPGSYALAEVFPDAAQFLGGDLGYITLFCAWGGLVVFTSLQKGKSLTLEHTF